MSRMKWKVLDGLRGAGRDCLGKAQDAGQRQARPGRGRCLGKPGKRRTWQAARKPATSRCACVVPPTHFRARLDIRATRRRKRKWLESEVAAVAAAARRGGVRRVQRVRRVQPGPAAGFVGPGRGAMKLYSLGVLYKGDPKVVLLKNAHDVSSFSFFQRSRCAGGWVAGWARGRGSGVGGHSGPRSRLQPRVASSRSSLLFACPARPSDDDSEP